jgi:molybdate transport system regulatory protein
MSARTSTERPGTKNKKAAPVSKTTAPRAVARFRMRVMRGDSISVGPGKIALLEAIAETRSITAAAKSMGMSYRRAWMLVDELNAALKKPAVVSAKGGDHGGGSGLTPAGTALVATYRQIEARAADACAADIKALLKFVR